MRQVYSDELPRILIPVLAACLLIVGMAILLYPSFKQTYLQQPIKIGVLHSQTGVMSQSEIPLIQAILMAVDEMNERGGVLGREVVAVVRDTQSTDEGAIQALQLLLEQDKVEALFGCWTSSCRKSLLPMLEQSGSNLFYSVQYEGIEETQNIVYLGATPNQQIFPSLKWALDQGHRRFLLVGSDYVYPHLANAAIARVLELFGAELVGEIYVPLTGKDMAAITDAVQQTRPDMILNTINGAANSALFDSLQQLPESIWTPVLSFSLPESVAKSFGPELIRGHFLSWSYFEALDNPANHAFLARCRAQQQRCNPSDPVVMSYSAVQMWAQAVDLAGTTETARVRSHLRHVSLLAPAGVMVLDPYSHNAYSVPRIGKANADGEFQVIWSGLALVKPALFPMIYSKVEWQALQRLHQQAWSGGWSETEK